MSPPHPNVTARYVFVTDELPRPGEAGHLAMNHAILAWLAARGHDITVLLTRPRLPAPFVSFARFLDRDRVRVEGRGMLSLPGAVVAPAVLARRLLPARLRQRMRTGAYGEVDAVLGRFIDAPAIAWCAARIAALRPRAVLIDTIFRAPLLGEPRLAHVPSTLIAHDIFHRRHAALRQAGYRLFPPHLAVDEEAGLLAQAGAIAAIQPEEAAELREMLPDAHIFVATMPTAARPRPATTRRIADRLVFLGSDTLPNVDGLRWFLSDIWPDLRAARPTVTLDVVGTVGRAIFPPPDGVNLLGRIADLAPALHRASLGIAPLRAGSGLKVKLLDLFAHGLAVVATPAAAAGFPVAPDALRIADPAIMADLVLRTLDLPGEERDAAALAVAEHYRPDHVFAQLGIVLNA